MLGPSGKILVGGTGSSADVPPCPEFAEGEPVSWHSPHPHVYQELLYSFQVKKIFDGSTLDETFAAQCIEAKVVYVGMVFTQKHKELLEAKLANFEASPSYLVNDKLNLKLFFSQISGGCFTGPKNPPPPPENS